MLRETIHGTLFIILATGAASAQPGTDGLPSYSNAERDAGERKNDKDIDRNYQSTMTRLPDKEKKNSDPWGDVRPAPPAPKKKN
jgi:hypothetical protein